MSRARLPGPARLHAVALDVTLQLIARREVRAVALTGSLARGDADPGSDVDLWVVGPQDRREGMLVDGTPVTLLWQTPRQLLHPDTLLLYEIEDAWVLHDPDDLFGQLRAAYRDQRGRVRVHMLQGTLDVVGDLLRRGQASSPAYALSLLREAARRAACLAVYAQRGWRVPRWRQFARVLPAGSRRALERALGFPPTRAQLVAVERALHALWAARGGTRHPRGPGAWPPALPGPAEVARLRGAGRERDLLLQLRQHLLDEPARARSRPRHLALWQAAHGVGAQVTRLDVADAARALARLLRQLRSLG